MEMWKKVLTWLVVRAIGLFYAWLVVLYYAWKYVTNSSVKFWRVKRRDTAPDCLSDPQLGQHSYIQLKVSVPLSIFMYANVSKVV
jgi:hypothetical protein